MNPAIQEMLNKYQIKTSADAENALKEIIQQVALLGLHRANFFEKAAFYGGTALRVLYNLPRYSEDLDFTLFNPTPDFQLTPYFGAVKTELESCGFHTEIERVSKKINSDVESAFIKANTKIHFLKIESLERFESKIQAHAKLQIKFEVDTEPASNFEYEPRYLLAPTSFPVITLKKPDLFAGKIHALLFRKWKNRVKGRDFYDYVWYLKNQTQVRIDYLKTKSIQSGHCKSNDLQTLDQLKGKLFERFETINFEEAKKDVSPFIKDPSELTLWSSDFFKQITEGLTAV
ncbi:MAG: nucleotidyl transferase AbiEii/AbiGii toxin family protein [Bdellovibrionaceae bacterium]|nr:nucleotidyl transferase AbiEii/AbiGii toxin family protein [Pseudobdellovibrionaceae bacterium]